MTINQVIAHLKMLKFVYYPHHSSNYYFVLKSKGFDIRVTISTKRIHVWSYLLSDTKFRALEHKSVRTRHKQGLRFLVKYLHDIEQGKYNP